MVDKEVVIDLYDQGYAMFEIADKLAVPESIIRDILREYLTELGGDDEDG